MPKAAEPALDLLDGARIKQVTVLARREQLVQQLRIEPGRLARLGNAAIVLVHIGRGERKQ